jgi:hypothetical protein
VSPWLLGGIALAALAFSVSIPLLERAHHAEHRGAAAHSHAAVPPKRPALTEDEERYIRALWPIHGDVERSAMRVSLGQIFYMNKDLPAGDLQARVEQAVAVYKGAQGRIHALEPPASLRAQHDDYLHAVRLFEESALEIRKMFRDGRDDHLLAAYPKGQAGADKIREIGGKFWPNEFPPH